MNNQPEPPSQMADDLSDEVMRQLQQTIGRLFHEGIQLNIRLTRMEKRMADALVMVEQLRTHYETHWQPKEPVEPTPGD